MEFARYAFNKSHAAAYAVIAYQTAYLKKYYKLELYTSLLNSYIKVRPKLNENVVNVNQDNVKRFTELIEKNNAYSKCMLFPTKNIKDTLYVYEYIDGKDLFEYFYKFKDENPIIRINKSIPIFIKILEILNFINENGFLWTDIKLENFMITKNEDVVAIDLDEIQKKGSTSELLLYSYNYFNEKYLSEKYMCYLWF